MSDDKDPQQGGSYLRDPETGALVPATTEAPPAADVATKKE